MYSSVKKFVNVPMQIKPFVSYDGAGDASYGQAISTLCYPCGKVTKVTNKDGVEVISTLILYVDGEPVSISDSIIFNGTEHTIHAIAPFYRNGVVDLQAVYV